MIGRRLVAALQRQRRGGHGPEPRTRCARSTRSATSRPTAGTRSRNRPPAAGARRPRRRRPPRRRAGPAALERPPPSARSATAACTGTENLVAALRAAEPRPRVLVSSSAIGYYGARGAEPLDEEAAARRATSWRRSASRGRRRPARAEQLGMRVVTVRTGVVLDRAGGALAKMLPPVPARHRRPGRRRRASTCPGSTSTTSSGCSSRRSTTSAGRAPVNATAPAPVTNREFSRALGRALHRPARAARAGLRAARALRRDGPDRHDRRARRAGQAADARLRVPPPASSTRRAALARARSARADRLRPRRPGPRAAARVAASRPRRRGCRSR